MPRTYKPTQKRYKKHDPLHIKKAIKDYENGGKSLFEIEKHYGISKSVLHRHIHREMKCQGGQTALKKETEIYIIQYLNVCSEWGYPLDIFDLRTIIKGYLDKRGIEIKRFKNNLPGLDYAENFLKRNKDVISERIIQNIKKVRPALSPELIEVYFKKLKTLLKNVPLSNIVNYNELNLTDDPARRKVVTKRFAKYPERIMNHPKSSTSLMMSVSADGTLLPFYVVYKGDHVSATWTKNGPANCRYNKTSSGWFDAITFEDWVDTVALPFFEGKNGKKVLIGENISTHLSIDLIRRCKEQNVHFVFVPAKSSHLTQPLDVAIFSIVKGAWRDILFAWKITQGEKESTISKNSFPKLLSILLRLIEPNIQENILVGFAKSGINPINKAEVLTRFSSSSTEDNLSEEELIIDETVLSLMKDMLFNSENTRTVKRELDTKPLTIFEMQDDDTVDLDMITDFELLSSDSTIEESKNSTPKKRKKQTKRKGAGKKTKSTVRKTTRKLKNKNKLNEITIYFID